MVRLEGGRQQSQPHQTQIRPWPCLSPYRPLSPVICKVVAPSNYLKKLNFIWWSTYNSQRSSQMLLSSHFTKSVLFTSHWLRYRRKLGLLCANKPHASGSPPCIPPHEPLSCCLCPAVARVSCPPSSRDKYYPEPYQGCSWGYLQPGGCMWTSCF